MAATRGRQPRSRVRPLRRYYRHDTLEVNVLGVYGYRASCDCGWTGQRQATHAEGRAEARAHRAEAHP